MIIFADNTRIHTVKDIQFSFVGKVTLPFNAAHSARLSLSGEWLNSRYFCTRQKKTTKLELVRAIQDSLFAIDSKKNIGSFARHTCSFLGRGVKREDII